MSANRKLKALGYDHAETFSLDDESAFRSVIAWLDTQFIAFSNEPTKKSEFTTLESPRWDTVFAKFLQRISCPFDPQAKSAILDHMLNNILRLRYSANRDVYEKEARSSSAAGKFSKLDLNDKEVQAAIDQICTMLRITQKIDDPLTVIRAIEILICDESTGSSSATNPENQKGSFQLNLKNIPLGFETNDTLINRCAAIMRLLYIKDLRNLQTSINQIIAQAQLITADPKTDSKLAKIGF